MWFRASGKHWMTLIETFTFLLIFSVMDWPLLSLLPIGVAAAVSPCPLATNIAAVGFISRGIGSRHQSAIASLLYTLGAV